MRHIDLFVVHCSATQADQDIGAAEIREWHILKNHWSDIGYHYVIRRDGTLEVGRPEERMGAHAKGHNAHSIGICLVGGLDEEGNILEGFDKAFTPEQAISLRQLLRGLRHKFPGADTQGHRDLSPDVNHDGVITPDEWLKNCPCFDVSQFT